MTKEHKTAFQVIMDLHKACGGFHSVERAPAKASGSEVRRWFSNKAIEVNGMTYTADDPWPPYLKSIVMFPNSKKRRCTLFHDSSVSLITVQQ